MQRVSDLLKQPIAFHPILAEIAGCLTGGVFLSQALYWTRKSAKNDGWFWKTREEWKYETTLTRSEQEHVRCALGALGLIEEREDRIKHRLYFRVNMDRLDEMLKSDIRGARPRRGNPSSLRDGDSPASPTAIQSPPCNGTETTAETTPAVSSKTAGRRGHPDYSQFVSDWMAYYQKRNNAVYPFGGRDGKAAKLLLQHFETLQATKDFIKACHARRKEGFPFSNTETLYDIANGLSRLIAALAQPPRVNGAHKDKGDCANKHKPPVWDPMSGEDAPV